MRIFIRIIAFILIIWLGLYFWKPELFIKDNYDVDTININKYVVTPSPWKIFAINLKVSSTNEYNVNSLGWSIQLYFDAVDIFETRILDLLENSSDKKVTLNTHIKQLQYIQNKLENAIANLENTVTEEEIKYTEYYTQKQQWDTEFWEWFTVKDVNLSINGFNTSLKNWPIATQHRIMKNAGLITLKKLKRIKYLIDAKLTILENENETIVNNFYVIKWDLLQKLQKLKYQLETNRYTD